MSPASVRLRQWAGAAIAGIAIVMSVFALLGALISPPPGECLDCSIGERRFLEPRITRGHGEWVVRVKGLAVARRPDGSVFGVPGAVFCSTWDRDCVDPEGRSGEGGAFDLALSFTFETVNHTISYFQEDESLIVRAPGCEPQELRVRDHRAPHRRGTFLELVQVVTLECPRRSEPLPPRNLLGF